jgi:hypothetical protein
MSFEFGRMRKTRIQLASLLVALGTIISCSEILFETDISESFVNILAPSNYSEIPSGTISFNWESVENADNYNIQIATPNFENARQILADSNVVGTSFQWQLLPDVYEWRIRAQNSAFETEYFSNFLTVTQAEDFSSQEVILLTPPDKYVTNESEQTLSWESVKDANEYRVLIYQPNENGTLIDDQITSNTSIVFEFADAEFTWQVRAQNSTQNTLYYSRTLLVDTVNPNDVTLIDPTNNSVEDGGPITFKWGREDIVGSKEFDSLFIYNNLALSNLVWEGKSSTKELEVDLEEDTYYWVVKPFDEAGNKGSQSAVFNFQVVD